MKFIVMDSESDGFAYVATKLHVLAWTEDGENYNYTHDYDEMRQVLSQDDCMFVAHNAVRHDMPLINRILGLDLKHDQFVDSLFLSWYLNFDRDRHGLEEYGVTYGVPKPKITDWESLTKEEYAHRVVEDVKINWKLWKELERKLGSLYGWQDGEAIRLIKYLSFKADCAREQESNPIYIDVQHVQDCYDKLDRLQEEKVKQLSAVMPKVPVLKVMERPAGIYKKDGSLSVAGEKWFSLLEELKMPDSTMTPVSYISAYQDGNPNSHQQVKNWLFDLGWKPATFKYVKGDDGNERMIPQVKNGDQLCESVEALAEDVPEVQLLVDMGIIQHRKGVFKSLLKEAKDGRVVASVGGLTNTFRFQHRKPIVNLPKVDKPWGKEIRGSIVAPEGYTLCGADMVSLEDTTKRHYMKPYDPQYVDAMSEPGFDPHLRLAVFAGAITEDEYKFYEWYNENKKR